MDAKTNDACSRVDDLLHLHVEGELESIRENIVREHLAACAACRHARDELVEERRWFIEAAVKSPPLPARFRKRIIQRIAGRERSVARKQRRVVLTRAAGIAAALALAFLIFRAPPRDGNGARLAGEDGVTCAPPGSIADAPAIAAADPVPPLPHAYPQPGTNRAPILPGGTTFVRLPNFGDVLGLAVLVAPSTPRAVSPDPCRQDPNQDGKTDLTDVAYSFQIILGAPPPRSIELGEAREAEPECEELCVRA
jgi:hypothetical protein